MKNNLLSALKAKITFVIFTSNVIFNILNLLILANAFQLQFRQLNFTFGCYVYEGLRLLGHDRLFLLTITSIWFFSLLDENFYFSYKLLGTYTTD